MLTETYGTSKYQDSLEKLSIADISDDPAMEDCLSNAKKVAKHELTVFLTGETGVGKELFARAIHNESERASGPFVAVNCAAIPFQLIESTLFGHKKGSFTGAVSDMLGKFVLAHHGTLFLDEVGELSHPAQTKLLRALQSRMIEPVGGHPRRVDIRVIAATNKTREELNILMREDLYFRLSEFPLTIPPLRERPMDVARLSAHFLKYAVNGHAAPTLDEEAKNWLAAYSWPGNVREMENLFRSAVVMCENNVITIENIESFITRAGTPAKGSLSLSIDMFNKNGTRKSMEDLEAEARSEICRTVFIQNGFDVRKTAEMLDLKPDDIAKTLNVVGAKIMVDPV